MFRARILPLILVIVYKALRATWRVRIIESPSLTKALKERETVVFAHWHGDELGILFLLKYCRGAAMISTSKDGVIMDGVVRLMGARTSRGSSTRGGVSALKGILRLAKEGWNPSVAVDGPKGPYHKVKAGVFEISKITGREIIPVAVACDRAHVFERAWNRTFLPMPFAKLVVVFADPLPAITRDQDPHQSELAESLEKALANAKQQASNLIAASRG